METLALGEAVQDVISLYSMTKEILDCDVIDVNIFEDKQSATEVLLNENRSGRIKHLDVKLKYIRDINKYNIHLEYVLSENQLADLFTKSL